MRRGMQNAAAPTCETIFCERADFAPAAVRAFAAHLGPVALGVWRPQGGSNDVASAYKVLLNGSPRLTLVAWVRVLSDSHIPSKRQARIELALVPGNHFGGVRCVLNYNLYDELMTFASNAMLAVVKIHYFDDAQYIDPDFADESGMHADECLYACAGTPFAPKKRLDMSLRTVHQGIETDFSGTHRRQIIKQSVPQRRRLSVASDIDAILQSGCLPSGKASSIRGRAKFAISPLFGRVGRAAMQPLIHRQYYESDSKLTPELRSSLEFLSLLAKEVPSAKLHVFPVVTKPVIVLTDAMEEGNTACLGFVVFDPSTQRLYMARRVAPPWMRAVFSRISRRAGYDKQRYIGQFELAAAPAVGLSLPHVLRGQPVLHYIDNTSALASLIHGYSGKPDSARLVNLYHLVQMRLRSLPWLRYVPSELNIADWPSRIKISLDRLKDMGAIEVPMVLPTLSQLTGPWADACPL